MAAFLPSKPHDQAAPSADAWRIRRVVVFEIKIKRPATCDWQCAWI